MNKKRKMNRTSETECTQMTWVRGTMPETQMFKSYASIMHCMQKEIMETKKNSRAQTNLHYCLNCDILPRTSFL